MDVGKLRLVTYPDPVLRRVCRAIPTDAKTIRAVARRMFELMKVHRGIGLAAPQVGLDWRLFVTNLTGEPADERVFIDPRLSDLEGEAASDEGCLSIPAVNVRVLRAKSARITALDADGRSFEIRGEDLAARCWQHEFDHLDGRLIIDRMSEADRIATRKALRHLESEYKPRTR